MMRRAVIALILLATPIIGCRSKKGSTRQQEGSATNQDPQETARQILTELRARGMKDAGTLPIHAQGSASTLQFPEGTSPSTVKLNPRFNAVSSRQLYDQLIQIQAHWLDSGGRQEWFEANPGLQRESRSVVSLVYAEQLRRIGTGRQAHVLAGNPLRSRRIDYYGAKYPLCEDVPYLTQPMGAFCSGVLVSKRVVATAAHCVETDEDAKRTRFVFGFRMTDSAHPIQSFSDDEVYSGSRILIQHEITNDDDWQLIELTKDVLDKTRIASLRTSGTLDAKDTVYAFGHPNGLPIKISTGGHVRDDTNPSFFVAGLDVFTGSSGGPVYGGQHMVEGILARGDTDYYVPVDQCMEVNNCPSGAGCLGDEVIRAKKFSGFVPK